MQLKRTPLDRHHHLNMAAILPIIRSLVVLWMAACAAFRSGGPSDAFEDNPNFQPDNWRTLSTFGCYQTETIPEHPRVAPRFLRIDVQRNRVTGAIDSVVGTSGEPGYYVGLGSSWSRRADSLMIQWWNGTTILSVSARIEASTLRGTARPGGDFGSWPDREFRAVAVPCDAGPPRWHYVSIIGGKR
jgi:hypothetical protein